MESERRRLEFLAACAAGYEAMEYAKTPGLSFVELEQLARQISENLGGLLLQHRLHGDPRANPEAEYSCPKCNGKLRIQERQQMRKLRTTLGEITYRRPYGVCDRCKSTCVPLDRALGIPRTGSSISHRQKVCHASVVGRSFEDGHEVLMVQAGIMISPKHVRTIAEQEGRRLIDQQRDMVELFQQGKYSPELGQTPVLMVVTCDGGRVQTRHAKKEERWKEDKIGAVYDAIPQPDPSCSQEEYQGAVARTKTYVATMQSWEEMGWFLRLEAEQRGYCQAKEKVFIADGARLIRELKNLHFPEATFILDWPHVVEHLMECAKAAFGEGTPHCRKWFLRNKQLLWDGKINKIIEQLQKLSVLAGPPAKGDTDSSSRVVLHRNANSYFPNNKAAMNYPFFRSKGWPLGSGVAEGAVKQFALRIKGSEKFWNIPGAEEMLALSALYHSQDDRWTKYWLHRSQT